MNASVSPKGFGWLEFWMSFGMVRLRGAVMWLQGHKGSGFVLIVLLENLE